MKKAILLIMSSILMGTSDAATVTTKVYAKALPNCSGNGICKVTTSTNSPQIEGQFTASWTLSSRTVLIMNIPEEAESEIPADLMANLQAGRFIMEHSFPFPAEIASMLESDTDIIIPAGTYTVTRSDAGFSVRFLIEE